MKRATARLRVTKPSGLSDEQINAQMTALPVNAILAVKLDASKAARGVLTLIPQLFSLRDPIVKQLPLFDVRALDHLARYAQNLSAAHDDVVTLDNVCATFAQSFEPLYQAINLRRRLVAAARVLADVGHVDRAALVNVGRQNNLRAIATDLMTLHDTLAPPLSDLAATSAPQLDLAAARAFADRIDTSLAAHAHQFALHQAALETRARAFTLLHRAYDQVRRAITYLHWDDNAERDRLAPSLYSLANGRR